MKFLVFILFPFMVVAQPKKGTIYSVKKSFPIEDSMVIWQVEKPFSGKLLIGEKTFTIHKDQYAIDTFATTTNRKGTVHIYHLSFKAKKYRCYVYSSEKKNEWELLFDDFSSLVVYKVCE